MRIQALEAESFRGFAEKRRFEFSGVQVLLLYGPNGHGKTSFFDALEWGLTGEIHRYRESSDERNHTRFVGNLMAGRQPRVCLEIMHEGCLLKVTRVGTAPATAQTDYGESEVCIEGVPGEPVTGQEAEVLLQQLLVQEEWQGKVDAGRTLHLTHMLGQEQMNRFLRGMKGKERYDAVSVLAGTDEFMRYKELFAETQKELEGKRKEIQARIKEGERELEHASLRVTELKAMLGDVSEEEEAWLREYVEQLGGTFRVFDSGQQGTAFGAFEEEHAMMRQVVDLQHKELLKERYAFESGPVPMLEAALAALPKWKEARVALFEGEARLARLEHLYEFEKKMREVLWLQENCETYAKGVDHQAELRREIESLLQTINLHQTAGDRLQDYIRQLEKATSSRAEAEALLERISEWDSQLVNPSVVKDIQMAIRKWLKAVSELNAQAKRAEEAQQEAVKWKDEYESIRVMNEKHRDLLMLLQEYVAAAPALEACPACGSTEKSADEILHFIKEEQGRVNPELPMITQRVEESRKRQNQAETALIDARLKFGLADAEIRHECDHMVRLHESHVEEENKAKAGVNYFSNRLEESEYLLSAFKERAEKLGLEPNQVKRQMLAELLNEWEAEAESLSTETPEEERVNLLAAMEKWKLGLRSAGEVHEQFAARLAALGATNEMLAEEAEAFLLQKQQEQRDFLADLIEREQNMLRALSAVDTLNRLWEVRRLEAECDQKKTQLDEYVYTDNQLSNALSTIKDAINAIPQAIDRLNQQALDKVSSRMQEFFSRLNPHPLYRELDFTTGLRYRNNNLAFLVKGDVEANPSYIFSSAQVNAIALSFFLAMALQQQWSPLQLIAMDDPVQSMDDLNVIALVDLIRVLCDPSGFGKQFVISTHDPTFHKLMRRKFRFLSIGVIEYEGYGEEGPILRARENEKGAVQYVDRIPRRTMGKLPPDLLLQG